MDSVQSINSSKFENVSSTSIECQIIINNYCVIGLFDLVDTDQSETENSNVTFEENYLQDNFGSK